MGEASRTNMTTTTLATLSADINSFYVLISACMVLFMHAGFGMLEVGGVQAKNSKNILLKNLLNACFSGVSWYILGYTLSTGPKDHSRFLGWTEEDSNYIAMAEVKKGSDSINWFFGWAFAATAATIVSGALAERTQFRAYFCFSTLLTAWIYPVVAYWVWNPNGWLKVGGDQTSDDGFLDFAGSGVVHMVGGACALVGAYFVGPRKHMDSEVDGFFLQRFSEDDEGNAIVNNPYHNKSNPALATVGTMILWFGWFGFNGGSQFAITGDNLQVVSLVVVNTTLCPAAAVVTLTLLALVIGEHTEIGDLLNAALGGLVSITANCNVVEPWAALVIGVIGAFVYRYSSKLLIRLQIDDVINASPVHFFCGIWGLIATGLFMDERLAGTGGHKYGCFMGDDGTLLGWQLCGIIVITLWTAVLTAVFLLPLHFLGMLRLSEEEEQLGLDGMMLKYSGQSVTGTPPSPASTKRTAEVSLDLEAPAATGVGVVHTGATPEQQPDVKRTCM